MTEPVGYRPIPFFDKETLIRLSQTPEWNGLAKDAIHGFSIEDLDQIFPEDFLPTLFSHFDTWTLIQFSRVRKWNQLAQDTLRSHTKLGIKGAECSIVLEPQFQEFFDRVTTREQPVSRPLFKTYSYPIKEEIQTQAFSKFLLNQFLPESSESQWRNLYQVAVANSIGGLAKIILSSGKASKFLVSSPKPLSSDANPCFSAIKLPENLSSLFFLLEKAVNKKQTLEWFLDKFDPSTWTPLEKQNLHLILNHFQLWKPLISDLEKQQENLPQDIKHLIGCNFKLLLSNYSRVLKLLELIKSDTEPSPEMVELRKKLEKLSAFAFGKVSLKVKQLEADVIAFTFLPKQASEKVLKYTKSLTHRITLCLAQFVKMPKNFPFWEKIHRFQSIMDAASHKSL